MARYFPEDVSVHEQLSALIEESLRVAGVSPPLAAAYLVERRGLARFADGKSTGWLASKEGLVRLKVDLAGAEIKAIDVALTPWNVVTPPAIHLRTVFDRKEERHALEVTIRNPSVTIKADGSDKAEIARVRAFANVLLDLSARDAVGRS